jgi:hypothetical protein
MIVAVSARDRCCLCCLELSWLQADFHDPLLHSLYQEMLTGMFGSLLLNPSSPPSPLQTATLRRIWDVDGRTLVLMLRSIFPQAFPASAQAVRIASLLGDAPGFFEIAMAADPADNSARAHAFSLEMAVLRAASARPSSDAERGFDLRMWLQELLATKQQTVLTVRVVPSALSLFLALTHPPSLPPSLPLLPFWLVAIV